MGVGMHSDMLLKHLGVDLVVGRLCNSCELLRSTTHLSAAIRSFYHHLCGRTLTHTVLEDQRTSSLANGHHFPAEFGRGLAWERLGLSEMFSQNPHTDEIQG